MGGAIFTSDDLIAEASRQIRVHGQSARYVHTRVGVGGRMDTIQCAVVLAKLERFHWEVEQRQILGDRYNGALAGVIPFVVQRSDRTSVFAQYTVFAEGRDELQQLLKSEGIPTAVHYPLPLNEQQAYRQFCCADCTPISQQRARQVMSLPMSPDMTSIDQGRIIELLARLR